MTPKIENGKVILDPVGPFDIGIVPASTAKEGISGPLYQRS